MQMTSQLLVLHAAWLTIIPTAAATTLNKSTYPNTACRCTPGGPSTVQQHRQLILLTPDAVQTQRPALSKYSHLKAQLSSTTAGSMVDSQNMAIICT